MTAAHEVSSLSDEFVRVRVDAIASGVQVDPTGDVVRFAFLATKTAEPTGPDWNAGSWETDNSGPDPVYYARVLVGPSGVVLTDGLYYGWVEIQDSPETPVRRIGRLVVT